MTYEQLVDFLVSKMKMSHIYQPLLIRSLVDAGGSATLRQFTTFFLSQDESQNLNFCISHVHRLNIHFRWMASSRARGRRACL
jgi:hypothetical protein